MTRTWAATDALNWASDSMAEQFGNMANYCVVSGCEASYSGANLNVTVAAGTIIHNGALVTVAGNVVTLVADAPGGNPRWSWVAINSSGVAVLVSGTPAADPVEPEVGDNVEVALVKVPAGATIASAIAADSRADRRIFLPVAVDTTTVTLAADSAGTTSTTLADVTGLSAALLANTNYAFRALIAFTSTTTGDYKFAFTVPAAATLHVLVTYITTGAAGAVGSLTTSGASLSTDGPASSTTPRVIQCVGYVMNGANAGDLQFQHALVTAAGTAVTKAKSRLEVY